jgi:hypothetical protein
VSEFAGKAVQHDIALAKRIAPKVPTVLPPFDTLTTDPQMIRTRRLNNKARMPKACRETLGAVANAAQAASVAYETVQLGHEHPYRAITHLQDPRCWSIDEPQRSQWGCI